MKEFFLPRGGKKKCFLKELLDSTEQYFQSFEADPSRAVAPLWLPGSVISGKELLRGSAGLTRKTNHAAGLGVCCAQQSLWL